MKVKVLLVINVISHYQVPLFNKLNEIFEGGLQVISTRDIPDYRKKLGWSFAESDIGFHYKILRERKLSIFGLQLLYSPGLFSIFRKCNYDVVLIGGYYTLTAWFTLMMAKLFRVKSVMRFATHQYCEVKKGKVSRLLKRLFIRNVDSFVAYGTLAKQFLVGMGAPRNRVFIEYDTVDVDRLKAVCDQNSCLVPDNRASRKESLDLFPKTVLSVGQLVERKNVLTIIKAIGELERRRSDIGLAIVGAGELEDSLRNYVTDNRIGSVKFIGAVPYDKVSEYYMAADVFCVMSTLDPYPLVVNEAMSFGCPIVISRNCGNSVDLIQDNGVVIEDPYDHCSAADAIEHIVGDDQTREAMGRASYDLIGRFNIDTAVSGISSAIFDAMKEERR